jgi:hypothetical protein
MMVLRFQCVPPIVSHQRTTSDDRGGHIGQAGKRTRHNRTITIDFHNEATYFILFHCVLRHRHMRPEVARDALLATHGGLSIERCAVLYHL